MAHPIGSKPAPREKCSSTWRSFCGCSFDERPDPSATPGRSGSLRTQRAIGLLAEARLPRGAHPRPLTQSVCEYRRRKARPEPLYWAKDTHALSARRRRRPSTCSASNGVHVLWSRGYAHARDLACRSSPTTGAARRIRHGIVNHASHNPPEDAESSTNPPTGLADTHGDRWIEKAPTSSGQAGVIARTGRSGTREEQTSFAPYVRDLGNFIRSRASARLHSGPIARGANWTTGTRSRRIRPRHHGGEPNDRSTFAFMTLDHDGKIRMDCSSP